MKRQAWGKTNREDAPGVHPLAHHCMDVAAVFEGMMALPVAGSPAHAGIDPL